MKIVLLRILFLLLLVFLQTSFFGIIFPWFQTPLFLMGAVISFTLVRGFPGALFMVVPLVLFFDTLSLGAITWFSPYAVFVAYVTSFLLRRLLLEQAGLGLLVYSLVSFGATLLYQTLFAIVIFRGGMDMTTVLHLSLPLESLLFSLILSIPIFIATYQVTGGFERYLKNVSQRQFRSVR